MARVNLATHLLFSPSPLMNLSLVALRGGQREGERVFVSSSFSSLLMLSLVPLRGGQGTVNVSLFFRCFVLAYVVFSSPSGRTKGG
jgi:hypothetical protein